MIVVSDTSPLHYLVLINRADVLPALFGEVYAPPDVLVEMQHAHTPMEVRTWAKAPPEWLKVQSPTVAVPTIQSLGPGETRAIALAHELQADLLLIDDRQGRSVAQRQGLRVVGLVAVLERAAERNLLDLKQAFAELKKTNFRIHAKYIRDALQRDEIRRREP